MAKVYASLIKKGLKIIKEVPEKLRAEVQAILDAESNAQTTIFFYGKEKIMANLEKARKELNL